MNHDTLAWLRWTLVPGLGLRRSHQLLNYIDSPEALFLHPERWPLPEALKTELRAMARLGEQHPIHRRALEQLHWAAASPDQHLVCLTDTDYPNPLSHISDPPLVLWVKGIAQVLQKPQVALVGSRTASINARHHAHRLAGDLAGAGYVITSGGATGIDKASHEGALAKNGLTIAILGCGVDRVYPKTHKKLFSAIAEQGAIVSEHPLGTQPRPGHFPRRNRIISGLSDCIVVVEAALKSGSLVTAQHALEQGRDVYAMPGDIGNPNAEGCHALLKQGAGLITQASDIDPAVQTETSIQTLNIDNLSTLQKRIVEQLRMQPLGLDALSEVLCLSAHHLLEPLLELELDGVIEQQPGGYCIGL